MEISNEKISELLNNPEIVGMIASLASGFSNKKNETDLNSDKSGITEETSVTVKDDTVLDSSEASENIFPDLISAPLHSDKRIALLKAIKPYVNDSKKDKVDSLVKAIGVAGVLSNYTGGIFGGLFGNISGKK